MNTEERSLIIESLEKILSIANYSLDTHDGRNPSYIKNLQKRVLLIQRCINEIYMIEVEREPLKITNKMKQSWADEADEPDSPYFGEIPY